MAFPVKLAHTKVHHANGDLQLISPFCRVEVYAVSRHDTAFDPLHVPVVDRKAVSDSA